MKLCRRIVAAAVVSLSVTFSAGAFANVIDVDPGSLDVTLAAGEMFNTPVSLTVNPFCVRPFEIDIVAPLLPSGLFQNLTGVLVNGCGGDTSTFDIKLTSDGSSHSFDIEFVDIEFGGLLATIPATLSPPMGVPEPSTLTLLGIGLAGLGWMRRRRRRT